MFFRIVEDTVIHLTQVLCKNKLSKKYIIYKNAIGLVVFFVQLHLYNNTQTKKLKNMKKFKV